MRQQEYPVWGKKGRRKYQLREASTAEGHNPGRMSFRDVLAYLALTGCALAFLWHFANIWLYGVTQAGEPNLVIRSLETVLFALLLGLGLERVIAAMRRGSND
jgi:hypothetical protein